MAQGIAGWWLTLCLSTAAGAAQDPVEKAMALAEELRFSEAARVLEAARAQPGLERPVLLRILEGQGVVAASLGRVEAARTAFRTLVVLEPGYVLKGNYSPKVMAPYYEAKGWVLEHGRMRFEAGSPTVQDGKVQSVAVRVVEDPLKLALRVRMHLLGEGTERVEEVSLGEREARVTVFGAQVRWWAELLGERGEVLEVMGSPEKPLVEGTHPLAPVLSKPNLSQPAPMAPSLKLDAPQWTAVGLAGGAVAAAAGGATFGFFSQQARSQLQGLSTDAQGRVVGMTQAQAFALDARARQNAVVADVLFVTSGVLVTAGAVLWFKPGFSKVALVPTGQGAVLSGVLP